MAEFEAYFDESGNHEGSAVTMVGGAWASASTWQSIIDQWIGALDEFSVSIFHASDLNSFRGEHSGWDEARRREFTARLLEVLSREKPSVIGICVKNDMYTNVLAELHGLNLSAYQFCCEWCMSWVGAYTKSKSPGATVEVVFESGQKFATPTIDDTRRLFKQASYRERYGVDSIVVEVKSEKVALQVADLIAYELYKYQIRKDYKVRHPLMQLTVQIPEFVGGVMSEPVIRQYLELTQRFIDRNGKGRQGESAKGAEAHSAGNEASSISGQTC